MVAARDGLDDATATERVREVLRLVEDARARHSPEAELSVERIDHLRRTALARLWLTTEFEPAYALGAIPKERVDALRSDPRFSHPALHRICQLVAVPSGDHDPAALKAAATDPSWRDRAKRRIEAVVQRFSRYLPPKPGPSPCTVLPQLLHLEPRDQDGVRIKLEAAGFDLAACAEEREDGSCKTPKWDAAWTQKVAAASPGHFIAPFETPFGWHWVYLDSIAPGSDPHDPAIETKIRASIQPAWRREAFAKRMTALRHDAAVKVLGQSP